MANLGDPLGAGIYCTTGFPLVMRLAWGQEHLEACALRRLNADEGCLESIGDDPNYGRNLAKQLNKSYDATQPGVLAAIGSQVKAQLEQDDRLTNVTTRVLAGGDQMQIQIGGETASGPFSLVAAVGDMTVEKMNQGTTGQTATTGST